MPSKTPNLCSLGLFSSPGSDDALIYIPSLYLSTDPQLSTIALRYLAPLVHSTLASIPNLGPGDRGTKFPFTQVSYPFVSSFVFSTVNPDMELPVLPLNPIFLVRVQYCPFFILLKYS